VGGGLFGIHVVTWKLTTQDKTFVLVVVLSDRLASLLGVEPLLKSIDHV
jgi:hypothetical protein